MLKFLLMNKKLSTKEFIFSQILILVSGLIFLGALYYILYLDSSVQTQNSFFSGGPVTKEPASLMLELTAPDDDLLVFDDSVEIAGKSLPNLYILITAPSSDRVIKSKSDGSFSTDIELAEGINDIKIISFDEKGEQKDLERIVYYSKEKL